MRVLLVTGEGIRDHVLACRVCVVRRRKAPSCTQGDIMVSGFFLILFRAFKHLHPCSSAHVCLMLAHLHTACPILIGMLRTYTANVEENPVPRTRNDDDKQWKRCKEESERRGLLLPFCPRCQCTTEKEMISSSPLSFRAISVRVACSSFGCWSAQVCHGV